MAKINKQMNYNFQIGKGIAGINFDFSVDKVIQLLGEPNQRYEDSISLYLQYEKLGLLLAYEREKEKWIDLDIKTKKLIYEGKNWYDYDKNELIEIIKYIYKKNNYTFDFDLTELDVIGEEQYDFYEIGVTLFFNKNKLKSIDVSMPIL